MTQLTSMPNIGKTMANKLKQVGIDSPAALRETGAERAFLRLERAYPNTCLVHLYALEGAVRGVELQSLPEERKRQLKDFHRNQPRDEKI